ncbi:MAG TPA: family 43 glycosylhydrolase, partial [Chitinophaga sp.]
MKRIVNTLLGCSLLLTANVPELMAQAALPAGNTYQNPLAVEFGDPYVLHVKGGKYYMYGTGGVARNGFAAYSSTDLVHWKSEGQVYYANNANG